MSPAEKSTRDKLDREGPVLRPAPARPTVTTGILDSLRDDIVCGRLARGSRLPSERDLAARFGVSQPTMREVVRALQAMGMVEVRHGSGAWVTGSSSYLLAAGLQTLMQLEQVSLLDAVDVRKLLGVESVRLAATHRTADDLAVVHRRLDSLGRAGEINDVASVIDEIAGFQAAVAEASHNALLFGIEKFLINLQLQMQIKALKSRGLRYWRERSLRFQPNRELLVAAIEAGDADAAVAAMDTYLEHTRVAFLSDPAVVSIRLTDKKAADAISSIVSGMR